MRRNAADRAALGVGWYQARYLCMLAAACAQAGQIEPGLCFVAEAKDLVARNDEHMWEGELDRIEGELMRVQGIAVGGHHVAVRLHGKAVLLHKPHDLFVVHEGCTPIRGQIWAPIDTPLAIIGFLLGLLAWWQTDNWLWILGALLLIANWPYTLLVIMLTNRKLMATELSTAGRETRNLIEHWARLHAARTALGAAATAIFLWASVS
jgi:hypothetical protein